MWVQGERTKIFGAENLKCHRPYAKTLQNHILDLTDSRTAVVNGFDLTDSRTAVVNGLVQSQNDVQS